MGWRVAIVGCFVSLALAACGRFGFDATAGEIDGGGDRSVDASSIDSAVAPFTGCVPGEATCDWTRRMVVVLSGENLSAPLSDVPIPLFLNAERFDFAAVSSAAADLRIGNADESAQLRFEIEQFDPPGAVVWVRVPSLLAQEVGAKLVVYYGNDGATAAAQGGVFDDDHVGVWHFDERGDIGDDSSLSQNDATIVQAVTRSPGIVGAAARFSGTSFLDAGTDDSMALTTSGTLEAWVNFDAITMFASPIAKSEFGDSPNYSFGFQRNGEVNGEMGLSLSNGITENEAITDEENFPLLTWVHFAATWDDSGARMFVDGVRSGPIVSPIVTPQVNGLHRTTIGCGYSPDCSSDAGIVGLLDEVRMSRVARSPDWISTSVRAMRDQLALYGSTTEL